MELFCHINEYEPESLDFLNPALLVAERLTLWGISKHIIDSANKSGALDLKSDDILDLVDEGRLQIVARQNWFDRHWRLKAAAEKNAWVGLTWDDRFDGHLSRLADADDHRVLVAPDDTGYKWAASQIEEKTAAFVEANRRLDTLDLPRGILEKFERINVDDRIALILRDAHNHSEARNFVRADVAIEPDTASIGFADLGGGNKYRPIASPSPLTFESTREVLRVISKLAPGTQLSDLKRQMSDIAPYRKEICSLMSSGTSFRKTLTDRIAAGYRPVSSENFDGDSIWATAFHLSCCVTTLIAAAQTARSISKREFLSGFVCGSVAAGVADVVLEPAKSMLRKSSVLSAAYDGPALPFALYYRTKSPTEHQIKEMLNILET